jgi:TolB-like protein/Tfp pilus assembly protein PilF
LGPYEILASLGAGGMGEVYRARDTRLGRDVAVKVLPEGVSNDPHALARFEGEARAIAALSHPNILALYDVGEASGVHFAVSELLEGETLRDVISRGALPIRGALEISEQIARGLAAAHEKGLVHRDVKPENVFITKDGDAKLLDFGLARRETHLSDSADTHAATDVVLTQEGAIVGTVAYMSPEQASGRPVDFHSDQFSLGIVLYEMLAGLRPFRRNTAAETLTAIIREEPEPLDTGASSASVPVRLIVERCLSKEPKGRYESTRDLARDLGTWRERIVTGTAGAPAPETGTLPEPAPARRKWRLAGVATFAVAVLVGAGVLLLPRLRSPAPATGGSAPIETLAVLPFENLMHDPSQDFFVDGMHDALITEVAKLGVLRVTSRSSVMPYKGKPKSMKEIAKELGVDALIEGSVLRAGNKVRITAQLIRGATDEHVWAESYDRDLEDVLRLLSDVSRAIANEVRAKVAGGGGPVLPPPAATPRRVRPEAWEAYLRGRQAITQGTFRAADFKKALEPFQRAVELDPGFAKGWSGVAMVNMVLGFFRQAPVAEVLPKAREAAQKALALDDSSGEAYGVLGTIQLYFDWDFESAKRNLERAVALAPHDLLIRHAWADYLMVTGRLEESVEQVKLGRSYEPTSPIAQGVVLWHTMTTHRWDEVIVEARRIIAAFPKLRMARGVLADALWRKGRYDEALEQYKLSYGADSDEELRLMEKALREAGPRAALKAYADSVASQIQAAGQGNPLVVAKAYAEAGERDLAFQWLEKAFAQRTPQLLHLVADPAYDDLREDPRYQDLVRRIGIPTAGGARSKT